MKTLQYNPSTLEVAFAKALEAAKQSISEQLSDMELLHVQADTKLDNPQVIFSYQDKDGDKHELVIKIIQRVEYN